MFSPSEVQTFARHWIEAWNSHDLDEIMSHYATDVILISPVAAQIMNAPLGMVRGKDALRAYFKLGLEAYPSLKFELIDVMSGISSIILYYVNQKGTKTGEFMDVDASDKVVRVVANYSG